MNVFHEYKVRQTCILVSIYENYVQSSVTVIQKWISVLVLTNLCEPYTKGQIDKCLNKFACEDETSRTETSKKTNPSKRILPF